MVPEERSIAGLALFPDTQHGCQHQPSHTSFTSTEKATNPATIPTLAHAAWAHLLLSLTGEGQVKTEAQL